MARFTPDLRRGEINARFQCRFERLTAVGRFATQQHSHAQLGVVQEVLHRVEAREHVLDLRAVGDGATGRVHGRDHARDVDVLDVWEVSELATSNLSDGLETTESVFSKKKIFFFFQTGKEFD